MVVNSGIKHQPIKTIEMNPMQVISALNPMLFYEEIGLYLTYIGPVSHMNLIYQRRSVMFQMAFHRFLISRRNCFRNESIYGSKLSVSLAWRHFAGIICFSISIFNEKCGRMVTRSGFKRASWAMYFLLLMSDVSFINPFPEDMEKILNNYQKHIFQAHPFIMFP